MNTILLWAVLLVLALVVALGGWALLRRRPRQGQRTASPPPARPDTPRPTPPATAAGGIAAPHQAATEALRQARRRKAEDETRLAAGRAAAPVHPRPAAADGSAAQPAASGAAPQAGHRPHAAHAAQVARAAPGAPSAPAVSAVSAVSAAPIAAAPPAAAAAAAAAAVAGRPAVQAAARRAAAPTPPLRPLPPLVARPEPVVPVLSPLAIQLNTGRVPITSPAAAPAGLAPLRTPPRPTRPPTVLVADDSKVVRVKTSRLLEKLGWRVLLADDGQAALRCLDDESPDLLITDVEMPGLDGFALTRHLRGHPRWARLPVIMITSSDDKHRAEAIAAGVDVLLGKPYAEQALIAQAQALLGTTTTRAPALH